MKKILISFMGFVTVICMTGCGGIPKDALSMNKATLEDRQMQTRVFDTTDEAKILSSCSAVLQDLGFNLEESETPLGLIVASKDRDATSAGQVSAAVTMTVLFGTPCRYDKSQKIKASIVTSPKDKEKTSFAVRVTFQRVVWDNYGQITKLERLNEPEMYQGFFDKLSKSAFLEAQGI